MSKIDFEQKDSLCSFSSDFFRYELFNWNWRATVGLVLDDGATDVAVAVAEAMLVVFALLADGDRVPADDGFVAFVVDIVANSLEVRVYFFFRELFKRFGIAVVMKPFVLRIHI